LFLENFHIYNTNKKARLTCLCMVSMVSCFATKDCKRDELEGNSPNFPIGR